MRQEGETKRRKGEYKDSKEDMKRQNKEEEGRRIDQRSEVNEERIGKQSREGERR